MGTHNICLYTEVDKKYSGCYLKTTELLDCALIGVCAVIRAITVCVFYLLHYVNTFIYRSSDSTSWPIVSEYKLVNGNERGLKTVSFNPYVIWANSADPYQMPRSAASDLGLYITKTYLYNVDPLKPHFYVVKLGFRVVYNIFLISAPNVDCGYMLEPPR